MLSKPFEAVGEGLIVSKRFNSEARTYRAAARLRSSKFDEYQLLLELSGRVWRGLAVPERVKRILLHIVVSFFEFDEFSLYFRANTGARWIIEYTVAGSVTGEGIRQRWSSVESTLLQGATPDCEDLQDP